ncbi:gluconate 2-dehydrogenase subunit 3 family protein [Flavobacteriaceae bacterium]|nr:gluconate 2-dehydrogenase subunit 3 family protein [Flavobacteriaceae bacterium]
MNRRKALKNIGMGFGAITATPAVVGLFQSCQTAAPNWTPIHFTQDQFGVVSKLMDIIIPTTTIPGAIELKLPEFLDGYVDAIINTKGQESLILGLNQYIAIALEEKGDDDAGDLTSEELEVQLSKYLRGEEAQQKNWSKLASAYKAAVQKDSAASIPKEALAYEFAVQLRTMTITAFKTNEYIGENVMAYVPIPGQQKGCVDLIEATGGKAYSL